MYDPLGINPAYDPLGIDKDESWGVGDTLRSAGAVLGGFAAMPVAGLGGLAKLVTSGNLNEASKTMEGISSVPSELLLTTERQKQAAGKVGELITKPFVMAGEGWQKIGEATGIPYAEPVLGTMGEVAGLVALGGAKGAIKGRIKQIKAKYDPLDILKEETKPSYDPLKLDETSVSAKVETPARPFANVLADLDAIDIPKRGPEPAKIIPAEAVKLDTKVDPSPVPIVQSGATSGGKISIEETVLGKSSYGTSIYKDGKLIGEGTFTIGDDGIAKVGMIRAIGGRDTIAPTEWRDVLGQLKEKYPQITKFEGDRITRLPVQSPSALKAPEVGAKKPNTGEMYWPEGDEAKSIFAEMKSELKDGQTKSVNEIDGEVFVAGSSYPQWFRDISKKHNLSATETTSFIDKYLLQIVPVPRTFKGTLTDRQGAIYNDIVTAAHRERVKYAESFEGEELAKEGFIQPIKGIDAASLKVGDELVRKGEKFKVTSEDADGFLTIKDGETFRVGPDDVLPFDHIKRGKPEVQTDLEGMGFKDTFDLTNPVTEIGRGVLSQKDMTPTRSIFDVAKDVNEVLQSKVGMTIEDVGKTKSREAAIARLSEDMVRFKAAAEKMGIPLSDFLKEQGASPEQIARMMKYAPAEPQRSAAPIAAQEGTPQGKESRLAIRAEADAIEAKLTSDFGDLVEYKTMNMKDQANRAAEIMDADYGKAKRMAMGEIKPPEGIREATMFEAVKIRAIKEGDVNTLQKLATESTVPTRLSEYGQAIKAADSRLMDDPVKVMQDVAKVRAEKAQKEGVKSVPPEEMARLNQRVIDLEAQLAARRATTAVEKIKNEVAKEQRQTKRTYAKEVLATEFDGLLKELNSVLGGQLSMGVDPTAALILGKMAKNRVQSGFITVEGLVDSIYTAVKNMGIDLSKRDIMDAISGYGKYKQLSKDEILVQLRDLKGQMQQISKLEDLQNRQPPLKTGVERRIPSNEERRLIKLVEEAKRKYGIQSVDPATQLKSSLDSIKTRLKNSIADITTEIESGERLVKSKGVPYDAEATALKKQRNALAILRDALVEEPKEFTVEKPGTIPVKKKHQLTQEQRISVAVGAAERTVGRYSEMAAKGDLFPGRKASTLLETPELVAVRNRRTEMKEYVDELRQIAGRPPGQALKSLKTRLKNEETKLVDKLKNLDFTKKDKRVIDLDPEAEKIKMARDQAKENYDVASKASRAVTKEEAATIVELSKATTEARTAMEQGGDRLAYGAARVAFEKYADSLKNGKQSIGQMIRGRMLEAKKTYGEDRVKAAVDLFNDTATAISDNSIAIVASVDNSFLGRQGINTLKTHPSVWFPAAKASFVDIYKTLVSKHGGEAVRDAVLADAYSRPNFLNGSYEIAKLIPKTEEQFPTSMPARLPLGIGRVFKASENAFLNSGVRMRINTFDLVQNIAKKHGVDVTDKTWIQTTGQTINSITARGDLGKLGQGGVIRLVLWAPKMLKGNLDVLTAHTFGPGKFSSFAKQQARLNLLKIVATTGGVAAIANAINPGCVETDPRNSDFMKIKIGKTRFDITGGMGSIVTLLARAITFSSKSTVTHKVIPLNSGKYGAKTLFDVGLDFLANKTTPVARTVVDITKGRNFQGQKPTAANIAFNLTTPIGIQNFVENFYGPDADGSAAAVVGSIADMVGINATTYGPRKK